MPALWGLVFADMPSELSDGRAELTEEENAIYAAVTFYAMHQQSRDVKQSPMSVPGVSLGAAMRRLASVRDGDQWDEGPIRRRFVNAATSDSTEEFVLHLRGLVQLLRAERVPLDYPALAADLYRFHFAEARDGVRRDWGLEFYRHKNADTTNNGEEKYNEQ
jgi:CRISPR system Cascade subunit CasB